MQIIYSGNALFLEDLLHNRTEKIFQHSVSARFVLKLRNLLLLALLPGATLCAQVTLPKILASHMVVQRDLPVHVWGMATPGEDVSVIFRGESRTAKAGQLGRWSVYLKPGAAGGPFQMTVQGAPGAEAPDHGLAAGAQRQPAHRHRVGDLPGRRLPGRLP